MGEMGAVRVRSRRQGQEIVRKMGGKGLKLQGAVVSAVA